MFEEAKPEPFVKLEAVKKAVETATSKWLKRFIYGNMDYPYQQSAEKCVNDVLKASIDNIILTTIGIDTAFGEFRVKESSPLYNKIREVAQNFVNTAVAEYIKGEESKFSSDLPQKIRDACNKTYEHVYMRELIACANSFAERKAREDVSKIIAELEK